MWAYRKMLRIPWTPKLTNCEVLYRLNKQTEIVNIVKRNKSEHINHVMKNSKYEALRVLNRR